MTIQVLGTGCPKCNEVERLVREALSYLRTEATIEKVTNPVDIARFKVLFTPAVAIDGKVKCAGRVPKAAEIVSFITTAMGEHG